MIKGILLSYATIDYTESMNSNMILKLQVALKEALTLYINLSNESSLFQDDLYYNYTKVYNIFEIEKENIYIVSKKE